MLLAWIQPRKIPSKMSVVDIPVCPPGPRKWQDLFPYLHDAFRYPTPRDMIRNTYENNGMKRAHDPNQSRGGRG